MKKLNKITSTVAAFAVLSSFAAFPVSAKATNDYSISYATITESFVTDDGTNIPSGAIAVTMHVENNTGFNANTFTLDIADGYSAITNEEGRPTVQLGEVLEGSLTSSVISSDNLTFCMTVASSEACFDDGVLFTLYFTEGETETSNFIDVSVANPLITHNDDTLFTSVNFGNMRSIMSITDTYYVGDTNGWQDYGRHLNNPTAYPEYPVITAEDAANILSAYSSAGARIVVNSSNMHIYCPYAVFFKAPDANRDDYIDDDDAVDILDYAAHAGAGSLDQYTGYVGKQYPYV